VRYGAAAWASIFTLGYEPEWSWSDYVAVAARGGNGRRYRKIRHYVANARAFAT